MRKILGYLSLFWAGMTTVVLIEQFVWFTLIVTVLLVVGGAWMVHGGDR